MKKIEIKLSGSTERHGNIKHVFNQFIDHLKLPIEKFNIENELNNSVFKSHTNYNYRVTYKRKKIDFSNHDDEYIDFEEFERWYKEQKKANQIPSIKYSIEIKYLTIQ